MGLRMSFTDYTYIPKNKLSHRIAFFAETANRNPTYEFYHYIKRDEVLLWLKEIIGGYNINWKDGYCSKHIISDCGGVTYVIYGHSFYFKNKEDAILFRLTWC